MYFMGAKKAFTMNRNDKEASAVTSGTFLEPALNMLSLAALGIALKGTTPLPCLENG